MVLNQSNNNILIHPDSRILGFNINGTRTAVSYGDLSGKVYERIQMDTPHDEPFFNALDSICAFADKLLTIVQVQRMPAPELVSIAISGDYQKRLGLLTNSPDLPEWKSAPIKGQMSMRFNLPAFVEQEANAGVLAEFYFGAGQGTSNFVFLSMEPTLRAGILVNGESYNPPGGYAGKLGELNLAETGPAGYGLPGTLNGFASAAGIVDLAHLRFPDQWSADISVYQLVEAVRNGDIHATQIFHEAGDWLGRGLSLLVWLLCPEVMIIGNPGCLLEDALLVPARRALERVTSLPPESLPKLIPSPLGSRLTDMCALAPAIDQFRRQNE